jgi:hypothetical protein
MKFQEAAMPMEALGVDLFELNCQHYAVLVDRYSGYPWTKKLTKLTTESVTNWMTSIFHDFGFPKAIRSDGGPQFRDKFTEYCRSHNIKHELSSAYNPRSNGLAESAVKNVKHLLAKCQENNEDFQPALAAWRNTPRADGYSPAQALFGRIQRQALPFHPDIGNAHLDHPAFEAVRTRTHARQESDANRRTRDLPELLPGDRVVVQDPHSLRWTDIGVVKSAHASGSSFWVLLEDGRLIRRNRRILRGTNLSADSEEPNCDQEKIQDQVPTQPRRSTRLANQKAGM